MNIASFIDHTQLRPDADIYRIEQLCKEAREHQFYAVCTAPYFVASAKKFLMGTDVKTAAVVGFPMGYSSLASKKEEIRELGKTGCDEIDIVYNIAALKSGHKKYVAEEIRSLTRMGHEQHQVVKIIFECGLIDQTEMAFLAEMCVQENVDFMKTSTGVNSRGAVLSDIELLRKFAGNHPVKIKASGGIGTRKDAQAFIEAGADRLGCSRSVQIVTA